MDRETFFDHLKEKLTPEELMRVQRGYWFAKNTHRFQRRDTGERYFEHCRRVASILIERNAYNADSITLALIHDVVEDGFTPPGVILKLFGATLYRWAFLLSKKLPVFDEITGRVLVWGKIDIAPYFSSVAHAEQEVRMVKLADRLDNLRSIGNWSCSRIERYIKETVKFIIPIAESTDSWFVVEFEKEVDRLRKKFL